MPALAFSLREVGSRWGVRTGQIWAAFRRLAFIPPKPAGQSCRHPHYTDGKMETQKLCEFPRLPAVGTPVHLTTYLPGDPQSTLLPSVASRCLDSKGRCLSIAFKALLSLLLLSCAPDLSPPCFLPDSALCRLEETE